MPRRPRFYFPGIPAHVIQRGNNRQAAFFSDNDYAVFLDWLRESAVNHGLQEKVLIFLLYCDPSLAQ
ncbi:MAG: hypothetical protein OES26_12020 [Gammaproteobacteria bacterium]|nr:hypothetical protein [Gammaproteobacteria bacterium]